MIMKDIKAKINSAGKGTNLFNLNDVCYYYSEPYNKIIEVVIYDITYEERYNDENELIWNIRYNGSYLEDELFAEYDECFKAVRNYLYDKMDNTLKRLERG